MRRVRHRLGALILLAALVPAVGHAASCLPDPVDAALARTRITHETAPPAPLRGRLYVDVSASMKGYFAGTPHPPELPAYPTTLLRVPEALSRLAGTVEARRFGSRIEPIGLDHLTELTQPAAYTCPKGVKGADCLNTMSRIQDVLGEIAADPALVAVVATDLFLSQEDLFGGGVALRKAMAQIIESGRTVGLLALRSAFTGEIFDLPGGGVYRGAKARPVAFLIIGPGAAVDSVTRYLDRFSLSDLPPGFKHLSLFGGGRPETALALSDPDSWPPSATDGAEKRPWRREVFLTRDAHVPQFSLPASRRDGVRQVAPRPLPLPVDDSTRRQAIRPDSIRAQVSLWRSDGGCGRWQMMKFPPPVQVEGWPDAPKVTLFPNGGTEGLLPGLPYLLHVSLSGEGLAESSPALAWIDQTWSFDVSGTEALLAKPPAFFPTLNLRPLALLMASVAAESAQSRPIADFVFAFRLQD
jgi:hypothetical protein